MNNPSKKHFTIAFLYAVFACAAIGFNMLIQKTVFFFFTFRYVFWLALVCGTGGGLLLKFVLDKFFIFKNTEASVKKNIKMFLLYSLMGLVTTAIFWCTEYLFHKLLSFENAKYLGGLIGLTIGYTLKYFLDRHFVFRIAEKTNTKSLSKG